MDRIERQILDILHQREFVLTDEGSVPANYQNRVAEYFRALSEKNDKDPPRR
jgi:hypothetical protein